MMRTEDILSKLIQYESVSPNDNGCQQFITAYLKNLGFQIDNYDNKPVSNIFASLGDTGPLIVFAGHTDVVSAGDIQKWDTHPFQLQADDTYYYGRGVADMKGAIASMLKLAEYFAKNRPQIGRLGFLFTSGEEGDAFDLGTPYVMEQLAKNKTLPDYVVVGEPTSSQYLGDMLKIGRRGSITAKLTLHGKQGHVAYAHLADNPLHKIQPALTALLNETWGTPSNNFPPTTFQITHIQSGGQESNVIPGKLELNFALRFSPSISPELIQQKINAIFQSHELKPDIDWRINGLPFITKKGLFTELVTEAIESVTGIKPEHSTSGGTSDARFIAPYGIDVIEFGLCNESIHQINEKIRKTDLELLNDVYKQIMLKVFENYAG